MHFLYSIDWSDELSRHDIWPSTPQGAEADRARLRFSDVVEPIPSGVAASALESRPASDHRRHIGRKTHLRFASVS